MLKIKIVLLLLIPLFLILPLAAQETPLVEPQLIQVEAADGLVLMGDFYVQGGDARPTVLLLHQLYTTRASWSPLLNPLLGAGYNVLAVDLRGYGATRGKISWKKAVVDVQTWLDWLRRQSSVRGDAIAVVGSSMGSNLALVGCANDSACVTVVAISPGLEYYGIYTGDAVAEGLANRSALLVYSRRDRWSAIGVPKLVEMAKGEVGVQLYEGNVHGMDLFGTQGDTLIPSIVNWLNTHRPQ